MQNIYKNIFNVTKNVTKNVTEKNPNFTTKLLANRFSSTPNLRKDEKGNIHIKDDLWAYKFEGDKEKEIEVYKNIFYNQNTINSMSGEGAKKLRITENAIATLYDFEIGIPLQFNLPSYYISKDKEPKKGVGMIVARLGLMDKKGLDINAEILNLQGKDISYLRTQNELLQFTKPEIGARLLEEFTNKKIFKTIGWEYIREIFNTKDENGQYLAKSIISKVINPDNIGAIKTAKQTFGMEELPNIYGTGERYFYIDRARFNAIEEYVVLGRNRKAGGFTLVNH